MKNEQLTMDELKSVALSGLKRFKDICEQYDLEYCLAYGTLLGGVRHNGFIPWDDDIDVWMPRRDYEKLILLHNEIEDTGWELLSHEINKKYLFPWAKLCSKKTQVLPSRFMNGLVYGVSIDVFPLDHTVETEEDIIKRQKIFNQRMKKHHCYTYGLRGVDTLHKRMIKRVAYIIATVFFGNAYETVEAHVNKNKSTNDVGNNFASIQPPVPFMLQSEWFKEYKLIKFEDEQFKIPRCYDEILTKIYGDYMKLPPEDKRVTHHSFIAVWK